ncbi:unnamed protein product [Sphagnum jensenii]
MVGTAELLTAHETCERKGYLSQRWEKNRLPATHILDMGIRTGLTYDGQDFGEEAGSAVYEFGATRGVDSDNYDVHSEVVHIASMADIISVAARKQGGKPWKNPDPIEDWKPSCFISPDGQYLRRIFTTPNWSEERQHSITRSWATLGPVAFYGLPMQIGIAITGNRREGRYHSFWSHALQHPQNKKLRFRKKTDIAKPFKESWLECWRPDHDEIRTKEWLDSMISDDVLRDVFFKIDVPRMEDISRTRVMDVAKRKIERIRNTTTLPDEQFTGCSFPTKCAYLGCCNRGEIPNGRLGFMPVTQISKTSG